MWYEFTYTIDGGATWQDVKFEAGDLDAACWLMYQKVVLTEIDFPECRVKADVSVYETEDNEEVLDVAELVIEMRRHFLTEAYVE